MKNYFKTLVILTIVLILVAAVAGLYSMGILDLSFSIQFQDGQLTVGDQEREVPLYRPVLDYETAVINTVDQADPSVVSIVATKDIPRSGECIATPFGFFFGPCEPLEDSSTNVEVGSGTGFIVSDDGLIVTNKHVVNDDQAEYAVFTNEGDQFSAEVVAQDPFQDIAIIKINAPDLIPVTLGSSDELKIGQTAIAIGNALGEFQNTVSVGVISGLNRSIVASGAGSSERLEGVIQTDAGINRGNSGGPLLNLKGEVVGVNTAIVSGAQNIGFAIPIDQVKRAIESFRDTGSIDAPFLGIHYFSISSEIAEEENLPVDHGALIRGSGIGSPGVVPGSAADEAGLRENDIILEVNGDEISNERSLGSIIRENNVGDELELKVLRNGEELIINATLGKYEE